MGRLAIVLACCLLVLAGPAHAQEKMCKMESQYGTFEYPCGSGETPPEEAAEDEPWYASALAQTILAVVGLVGSAGAAGYTFYRVRRRRRALTDYLGTIERTYAQGKADPVGRAVELADVRQRLRADHQRGHVDDAHFLELDKRATTYVTKLRLLEIDRRFPHLPPILLAEIRRLLSDGSLTQAEADQIEVKAAQWRIPDPARAELVATVRAWAAADQGVELEAAPTAP